MPEEENEKIIFTLPETTNVVEAIEGILKNRGLSESADEFEEKQEKNIKPRLLVIRDVAYAIARNKTHEQELIKTLVEDLVISQEVAKNIISDIRRVIMPYVKIAQPNEVSVEELIMQKIKNHEENPQEVIPTGEKKPTITNVEENAKASQENKKYTDEIKKSLQEGLDKEPIEKTEEDLFREPLTNKPTKKEEKKEDEHKEEHKKPWKNRFENERNGPDSYREQIEEDSEEKS